MRTCGPSVDGEVAGELACTRNLLCQSVARTVNARISNMTKRPDDVTIREPSLIPRSHLLHTEPAGTAPPDAFGPFRVLHQIGAGTLGPVFRAYDAEREHLVAVKLLKLDLAPDAAHRIAAGLELVIAAGLWHPALVLPATTGVTGVHAF